MAINAVVIKAIYGRQCHTWLQVAGWRQENIWWEYCRWSAATHVVNNEYDIWSCVVINTLYGQQFFQLFTCLPLVTICYCIFLTFMLLGLTCWPPHEGIKLLSKRVPPCKNLSLRRWTTMWICPLCLTDTAQRLLNVPAICLAWSNLHVPNFNMYFSTRKIVNSKLTNSRLDLKCGCVIVIYTVSIERLSL